jgi:hypothetical protein
MPDAPIEEWQAQLAFERERWEAERVFRRDELDLKREEQARSRWLNPLVIAILAAAVAALGNAGVTWVSSHEQRALERDRAANAEKASVSQSQSALQLEKTKAEASRILEVVKTNNPDKAAENLQFLIDTGLIDDTIVKGQIQTYLSKRKPGQGISLPTSQIANVAVSNYPSSDVSCEFPAGVGMAKAMEELIVAVKRTTIAQGDFDFDTNELGIAKQVSFRKSTKTTLVFTVSALGGAQGKMKAYGTFYSTEGGVSGESFAKELGDNLGALDPGTVCKANSLH